MIILLTNDDGIDAPGLKALIACLPEKSEAVVVAPSTEKSASSHSISLGQKLIVRELFADGLQQFRVEGTPADCIKFAVSELKSLGVELIVSGINQGANTGVSVYYSGTISAAREGFINRIPSIAVSLCDKSFRNFEASQAVTRRLIEGYRSKQFPANVMLNVNVPALEKDQIKGTLITKQAASRFIEEFVREEAQGDDRVYTLAGEIEVFDPDGTSDEEAVEQGYISITPLKLDCTDYAAMKVFQTWAKADQ